MPFLVIVKIFEEFAAKGDRITSPTFTRPATLEVMPPKLCREWQVKSKLYVAYIKRRMGNFEAAYETAKSAESMCKEFKCEDHVLLPIMILLSITCVNRGFCQAEEAKDWFLKAKMLVDNNSISAPEDFINAQMKTMEAVLLYNCDGEHAKACDLFKQASESLKLFSKGLVFDYLA